MLHVYILPWWPWKINIKITQFWKAYFAWVFNTSLQKIAICHINCSCQAERQGSWTSCLALTQLSRHHSSKTECDKILSKSSRKFCYWRQEDGSLQGISIVFTCIWNFLYFNAHSTFYFHFLQQKQNTQGIFFYKKIYFDKLSITDDRWNSIGHIWPRTAYIVHVHVCFNTRKRCSVCR